MQTFCTIITPDYLPFMGVLHQSLEEHSGPISMQVLVVGHEQELELKDITFHQLSSLDKIPLSPEIQRKYEEVDFDYLRWSLKPIFMRHLLQSGFEKVIFIDPDLYFVSDSSIFWSQLENKSILLSPHFTPALPEPNHENFEMSFQIGFFNAGFIGATATGIPALEWWAQCCLYKMERDWKSGFFVDQKYLDGIPWLFRDVAIIDHKGCNLGSWNIHSCVRKKVNGKVLIKGKYQPVFIHFNHETIRQIVIGNDSELRPYFDQYEAALNSKGIHTDKIMSDLPGLKSPGVVVSLKRKLKLRTRLLHFFSRRKSNL